MRILPAGDRALLVELDTLADARAAHRVVAAAPLDGVVEVIPGARTLLVRLGPGVGGLTRLEAALADRLDGQLGHDTGSHGERAVGDIDDRDAVRIPVVYDGDDLAAVADAWQCSLAEVARRHAATEWVCAFVGFAPGFPYLVPFDAAGEPTTSASPASLPTVPRRATSRPRVPAGSVALAADYCGVYPRESPGGWQLIGRTDLPLWDARRDPPALVTAGARVRFEAVRATVVGAPARPAVTPRRTASQESRDPGPESAGQEPTPQLGTPENRDARRPRLEVSGRAGAVRVISPGALTLVHDLGRPGLAHLGVGGSGAFDRAAHRLANRLVGNADGAASFEVLLGGAEFALPPHAWVAVTGAVGPVTLDGAPVPLATAVLAHGDGSILRLDAATHGLRYSVAVRGGLAEGAELGSRSRDTLAALGPAPLRAGEDIALADEVAGDVPPVDWVITDAPPQAPAEVTVRPGPRRDWFTDAAWERMLTTAWKVSERADRTGVRLDGPRLDRRADRGGLELPSEGMLPGAIQVSPDGVPTILGPDHPVTGGYPVIAVVTDDTRDRLAQVRPGDSLRLRLAIGKP